jgi:hypothetical protein
MDPIRVKAYTFTPAQLYHLLTETIGLYVEHVERYGDTPDAAKHEAAQGTQEGLDVEQELADLGELDPKQMSQVYTPLSAKQQAEIDAVQRGMAAFA